MNTRNTKRSGRDLQAQAEFERRLTKLSPGGRRKIHAAVIGLWLLERPRYLETVERWVLRKDTVR